MDDAHEHNDACEHDVALSIPEAYIPLLKVLADETMKPSDMIDALLYSTFRQIALKRGLPVAKATSNYVLAASAFDNCVRRLRWRALGEPIDEEEVEIGMLEEGRDLVLRTIDELVERLGEARAAYEVLYLEPDSVNPKEESRAVMAEIEAIAAANRKKTREELEDILGQALAIMFGGRGQPDTAPTPQ
jgi:hypothetical protein